MKNNKSGNVLLGLTLIFVGFGWMLLKLGFVDSRAIIGLSVTWPLILVIFGVGVIFKKRTLTTILWLLFIIGTFSYGYFMDSRVETFEISYTNHEIEQDYSSGKIQIDAGAGNINITSTNNQLISSEYPQFITEEFDVKKGRVEFKYNDTTKGFLNFFKRTSEEFNYKLNDDLNWDIEINCGAIDGEMDLRELYVNNLEIDCAASDLTLYLSGKSDLSTIDIDNGASDITVYVPPSVGVSLNYDGAIKDMEFGNASWIKKDGNYYSPDYENKIKKTIMIVDSGLGNIEFKYLNSDK